MPITRILIWLLVVALGVPTFSFGLVVLGELLTDCEMNPWAGYTCSAWMAPFVFLAIPGVFTTIPFLIVTIMAVLTSRHRA
jgi:hypothetical protein